MVSGSFLSFLAWSLFSRVQRTSASLCCYHSLTAFPVTYNWLPSLHWQGFQDSVTPIHITWDDTPSQNLSLDPICKIPLDVQGDRFRNEKIHMFRICYPVSHTYLKHDLSTDLSLGHSHAVLTWEGDGYGMKTSILVLLSVELRNWPRALVPLGVQMKLLSPSCFRVPAIYLNGHAHLWSVLFWLLVFHLDTILKTYGAPLTS